MAGRKTDQSSQESISPDRDSQERARPAGRREEVLRVASELIGQNGYDGTSMRDIAGAVGILPGSLYHHFPSKEELFVEVHAVGVGEFHDALDKALAGETDPWERLRIACRTHLGQTLRLGNRVAIVQPDLSNTSDDVRGRLIEVREIYEDRWRALVDDLGLRPEVSASLCRLMIFGAMNWATVWYREGGQSPEEIADAFVAMLRDGVAQHP